MYKRKRLYIIDGAGFYYRAFYGIRQNLTALDGTPTNAIYGFARMFGKIIKEEKPDSLLIALDSREKTFRHEMYEDYKANRQKMPEELAVQLPYIERLISAHNIEILKKPGFEADDLIGCAAQRAVNDGYDVTIVTGDKDLMQLVTERIKIYDAMKDKRIGAAQVKEKFGVEPSGVVEILGLMGDASDNIPGVPGVGQKTAAKLIEQYGDIENVLANAEKIKQPTLSRKIIENAEKARLSRELARIKTDIEIELHPDSWKLPKPDKEKLNELLTELDFKSMLEELGAEKRKSEISQVTYGTVTTEKDLSALAKKLQNAQEFAINIASTSSEEPMRTKLVGISFSTREGEGFYVPLTRGYEVAAGQLSKQKVLKILKPLLEDAKREKYGHNVKYDIIVLAREGIKFEPVFDTMLASYLLAPEERRHGTKNLAVKYLGHRMVESSDVADKSSEQLTFNLGESGQASDCSAEHADITLRLTRVLKKEITEKGMKELYFNLEMPLAKILARMEQNGIALKPEVLREYSIRLEKKVREIEAQIHETAGEEFNIASPKQLAKILFDKLKLKKQRKTKTGASTDQQVMETLALYHPLPALILRYRTLAKLKSTYVDPLQLLPLPETGRIHTSFNQAITATGRLSSSSPNLQNIPVRTEEGRKIRSAFHAINGYVLISADYSQIELRILAHLSGDSLLVESFKNDEDVHQRTAREIFGAHTYEPTPEMRQAAKAVNFGIIYGQTPFGLAKQLGVTRSEAQGHIKNYFVRYSGVKDFIEETIITTREKGFVTTMAGRKRMLPEIKSSNKNTREAAERMAVNSIVQGSSADLVKKAMIDIDRELTERKTKMLLQVHDELIFESPSEEEKEAVEIVRRRMESVEELSVPLKVSISVGKTWGDLH